MAMISDKVSESLREYLILTGWIKAKPEEVSLETRIGSSITLQYPYMTARMQCVVGPEMAVSAGRNGILTCIPRSLRDKDKEDIIESNRKARQRKGDVEYIENPEYANPDSTLAEAVHLIERTGHSVIPVMDRFSRLFGVYRHNPDNPPSVPPQTKIREIMTHLRMAENDKGMIPVMQEGSPVEKIKEVLSRESWGFVPVVDSNMILKQLAFLQKYDTNFIGIAISTREGWEHELEKWGPQVDTLMIDSSNACFDDTLKILREAKKRFPEKPFGIGNIIQGEHFRIFAEAGADYILGGMGAGSICQTGSTRGNGRGQFTVASELAEARDRYHKESGRYVLFVIDGGIATVKDMTVALAFGDLIMMGNYFNRFYESAARKFTSDKKTQTIEEPLIRYVETWGEGHPRARLVGMFGMNFREIFEQANPKDVANVLERYGQSSISSATVEGVVGLVEYRGRLKPCVEKDARYLRTTVSNSGARNLAEFRQLAKVERASAETVRDMYPHDIEITEK